MRTKRSKPALMLFALGLLLLPLLSTAVVADDGRGWDRGWNRSWDRGWDRGGWGGGRSDLPYRHRHHHHGAHGRGWDRGPALVYRDGPRYERPQVVGRTILYWDNWR